MKPTPKKIRKDVILRSELKRGIVLCINNSKRLFDAGKLLGDNKSYNLAIFAFCTAIEEVGKALHLISFYEDQFIDKKENALVLFKESFFSHKKKLAEAIHAGAWEDYKWKTLLGKLQSGKYETGRILEILKYLGINWSYNPIPTMEKIFSARQEMLYVNLKGNKFRSPKRVGLEKQYYLIMEQTETILDAIEMQSVVSMFALRRGATREKFAALINSNLPEIIKLLRSKQING